MPHLAEELWRIMGNTELVVNEVWPKINKSYIKKEDINLVIQINGKKKIIQNIPKGLSKDEVSDFAIKCLINRGMYKNQKLKKVIVIPDRIVNLVI